MFQREAAKLEEELGSENLDNSHKQALCSNLKHSVTMLDSSHAAIIQIVKSDITTDWLTNLRENKDYHRGQLKQNQRTAESGNQISLVSSTSAGDKDPNETVVDTRHGAIENAEENVGVSSRHPATQRSRKQPSIANLELENLRAKKETEQRL